MSTVSREIRRNCSHVYDIPTYRPQHSAEEVSAAPFLLPRGMFHSQEVLDYIEEKLRATLVAGADRLTLVS